LIGTDSEGHVSSIIKVTGNVEIYGNKVAGGSSGIALMSNSNDIGVYQSNNKIYQNIIVDCNKNFYFERPVDGWTGNEIYDNISMTKSAESVHSNVFSPPGVTWGRNYFDDPVSGNAGDKAIVGVVLAKQSGWRSLPAGEVNESFFALTDGASPELSLIFEEGGSVDGPLSPPMDLKIKLE